MSAIGRHLKHDILKDDPKKIAVSICLPLAIVSIVSWFANKLLQNVYSLSCKEYFAIFGLIGIVIISFQMVMACFVSAAWIKTSLYFTERNPVERNNYFSTSLCSIIIPQVIFAIILIAMKNFIFKWFSVPTELLTETNAYFIVCILSYILANVGTFFVSIINGVGSPRSLLISNLINSCIAPLAAFLCLSVFKLGVFGAALVPCIQGLAVLVYAVIVLRLNKNPLPKIKNLFKIDKILLGSILKAGFFMALQSLFCQVGDIVLSIQTNRFLPLNYIDVLSADLGFSSIFSVFSTSITIFVPANYQAGNLKRVKDFLKIIAIATLIYSFICAGLYFSLANWHFRGTFENVETVKYGISFWKTYSLAMIPVSSLFVFRFFLDSVGYNKQAMIAGVFQMLGALVSALLLVPKFGTVARSWSPFVAFSFAAIYIFVACAVLSKKIFKPKTESLMESHK